MGIKICPRCRERIVFSNRCVDVVHECNSGNPTRDNEDVFVVGDWSDYTGSGKVANPLLQGLGDKNFGRTSWVEGERVNKVTSRGKNARTHRSRQHLEYVRLKKC